jgi:phasin family protein
MTKSNLMSDDLIGKSQSFVVPLHRGNKLAVAQLDKLVKFQMSALQSYVELGLTRMKAATEVSSFENIQAFLQGQVEAAQSLQQRLSEDVKTLMDLMAGSKSELEDLAEDNANLYRSRVAEAVETTTDHVQDAATKVAKDIKKVA